MAELTIEISPAVESKLRLRAAKQGSDIATIALGIVEQALLREPPTCQAIDLTHEQRLQNLLKWEKKLPKIDVVLDFSRESIYECRGE